MDTSINSDLVGNMYLLEGNLGMSDISNLQALGLEVKHKDLLPKNLRNLGTMNHAAAAVGNWVNPTVCPQIQEKTEMSSGISQECHGK